MYAWILIKYQLHFDFLVVFTPPKALSTSLPCFVVIVLLKSALTSGRTLPGTTFFVLKFEATLQPLCSADRDSEIFYTAATALFIAVKGLSLQRKTAIFCYCCSQPFCSSFVALLEVILQRCSSAARFVRDKTNQLHVNHAMQTTSLMAKSHASEKPCSQGKGNCIN